MAARRLPRGTRLNPVRLGWAIEEERKELIDNLADRAGVSSAVILEAIIDHVRKDIPDGGLPPWMLGNQGVLPLPQAS
ncbi:MULTISPECIES: hypothetical protein [Micrococcaceae]|uniref:Ribbon-helix-helix protein CopG domain-containing protein n=1 Tax=Paenarthrobacter ureafaciens TaxID=37931 RepID=A0AAX3EPY7_PAEUR|nr:MULTISPECIES: hypothetical protein [Micrococcaceae]MCD4850771.1 hypothetical protein [Arthrobacter sp. AK01]MDO5878149.1 hypothetical protein [Paenarthrobacter sp. SD-1]NHW49251.1 hypothetical protein [Paenarthrobacter sp. MSM-2-10-13]UYW00016.1 hypothetical protein NL394_23015 [Paenarthrobacter ureafaciens]WIV33507.1 hypothetical protein QN084_22845 [Paenarthrobacter sp. R1]